MSPEQIAQARVTFITKRQELLETAVNALQAKLYEKVLINLDKITKDPVVLDQLFREFTKKDHLPVIKQFADDILSIGKQNDIYFRTIYEGDIPKDYAAVKKEADLYLLERFGISPAGKVVEEGFLDTFIKDPSIKRDLRAYAYKAQATSGVGLEKFKQGFKEMIQGTPEANGIVTRYYKNFAYDTYQQADAVIQNKISSKLELPAAIYAGTKTEGSRPFCLARKGKVFTRSEIASWSKLSFAGKPKNYDPLTDRGGYGCRDSYSWLTAKQALRRRTDLELVDGVLRVKT